MKKVGYLGPEGSYSYLAVKKSCPELASVPYHSFRALFDALEEGKLSEICVPIRNTVNGVVAQNLDLLEERDGIYAVGECSIHLDHRLATIDGAEPEKIERVYSHPQALEQCSKFLASTLPQAELIAAASTADGLKQVRDVTQAAIVGAHLKPAGFVLSDETISDEKSNSTYFLKIIKDEPSCLDNGGSRSLICFTLKHESGSLCAALSEISALGVNMTEIESRPIKGSEGKFRFFIEFEGGYKNAATVLRALEGRTLSIKLLGVY